uniref:hypothetical protein n=1 Tax=Marinitenerispora sediminis TaxID=1931232 RepID=UPI001313FF75|nr:hypothetical protein [Marinitenerispora sediminis]
MAASTVHRTLTRSRCARLAHTDRATGLAARRYECDRPGAPVHVDVKKLGRVPAGGGHRAVGRHTGVCNKQAATTARRNGSPVIGCGYPRTALDDHSRLAYTEIRPLAEERAYARPYTSEDERRQAFPAWLYTYTTGSTPRSAAHPPPAYLTSRVSTPRPGGEVLTPGPAGVADPWVCGRGLGGRERSTPSLRPGAVPPGDRGYGSEDAVGPFRRPVRSRDRGSGQPREESR